MSGERDRGRGEYADKFDLYQLVLETRNMELRLFWERANYFLALNTAIALGYFTVDAIHLFARLLLCFFGIASGILWVRTNLGSKFWQARWEHRLSRAEKELDPPMRLFSEDWEVIFADAKCGIESRRKGKVDALVNRAILTKPSVTRTMIALSVLAVAFWLVATCAVVVSRKPVTAPTMRCQCFGPGGRE